MHFFENSFRNETVMAILSRVSQRALWLRRISSMPVSANPGAEVPGKPRKHNGVRQSF